MLAVRVAAVEPAHAAAGQGQRNHPRQAAGRAFGRSRPSGRRSALAADKANPAASPEGFAGAVTVSRQDPGGLRAVLDAIMRQPAATLPAYVGVQAGADYTVARLEGRARQGRAGRAREPGEPVVRRLVWPRTRPWCASVLRSSCAGAAGFGRRHQASSSRLGGLTPVEQHRSAGHTLSSSWGWASSLGWMPSAGHGPVRRNAFHQEGTSRAFVLATVGNSCAKRCGSRARGRDLHAHDDHVGAGLARGWAMLRRFCSVRDRPRSASFEPSSSTTTAGACWRSSAGRRATPLVVSPLMLALTTLYLGYCCEIARTAAAPSRCRA